MQHTLKVQHLPQLKIAYEMVLHPILRILDPSHMCHREILVWGLSVGCAGVMRVKITLNDLRKLLILLFVFGELSL